jgi:hypothetical protein
MLRNKSLRSNPTYFTKRNIEEKNQEESDKMTRDTSIKYAHTHIAIIREYI